MELPDARLRFDWSFEPTSRGHARVTQRISFYGPRADDYVERVGLRSSKRSHKGWLSSRRRSGSSLRLVTQGDRLTATPVREIRTKLVRLEGGLGSSVQSFPIAYTGIC